MGLVLLHQNLVNVGIKSPSFAPSRVGKCKILYKTSSSSSCVLNVMENILMAQFNYHRFEFASPNFLGNFSRQNLDVMNCNFDLNRIWCIIL